MAINVLFVYGAGDDSLLGRPLREMQELVKTEFGEAVYSPRVIDYTEYNTLVRLLRQWNDPTILVGHSCGCMSITRAVVELSMEAIPYLMAIAPSVYCRVSPLPPNVGRATQVTSNALDFFNPGARMLLGRSPVNQTTVIDEVRSGLAHVLAPRSIEARQRLVAEVRLALEAAVA
jgi:hypothetical protein